ncbi:hypothetical protein HYU14_05830 [Candidatus Woesearchaeota archaeon]|nr:hypothetical protein [Candidatus Woesearchaeota archaeon]
MPPDSHTVIVYAMNQQVFKQPQDSQSHNIEGMWVVAYLNLEIRKNNIEKKRPTARGLEMAMLVL